VARAGISRMAIASRIGGPWADTRLPADYAAGNTLDAGPRPAWTYSSDRGQGLSAVTVL